MSQFNEALDTAFIKPIATAYTVVTPRLVRTGVSNFFSNLAEPWTAVNAALQGKGESAIQTVMRFSVNTVFGLGGVLDVASEMGIDHHKEDFGQTLGVWGVGSGPYFVLPVFGPSTLRDAVAFGVETRVDPVSNQTNLTVKDTLTVLRLVSFRASLLRAGQFLDEAALDKYSFTRDVFLQRRDALVWDGRTPPPEPPDPATSPAKP